jgi:hypothetical protein
LSSVFSCLTSPLVHCLPWFFGGLPTVISNRVCRLLSRRWYRRIERVCVL